MTSYRMEIRGIRFGTMSRGKIHLIDYPADPPTIMGRELQRPAFCGRDRDGLSPVVYTFDVLRDVDWLNERHICSHCWQAWRRAQLDGIAGSPRRDASGALRDPITV